MAEPPEPALLSLLGRPGLAALRRARKALHARGVDEALVRLSVAAWTAPEWSFRFEVGDGPHALVVSVPHDGPAQVITEGAGPNPFIPGR